VRNRLRPTTGSSEMVKLNREQRKFLAGVLEKTAFGYFAVIGYAAYTRAEWMLLAHSVPVFVAIIGAASYLLRGVCDE
jgi:hypothetical protein